jgi:hypothetical protein
MVCPGVQPHMGPDVYLRYQPNHADSPAHLLWTLPDAPGWPVCCAFVSLPSSQVWYDNRIISTELAPLTIDAYLKQRKRWAQGWLQVGRDGQGQMGQVLCRP